MRTEHRATVGLNSTLLGDHAFFWGGATRASANDEYRSVCEPIVLEPGGRNERHRARRAPGRDRSRAPRMTITRRPGSCSSPAIVSIIPDGPHKSDNSATPDESCGSH